MCYIKLVSLILLGMVSATQSMQDKPSRKDSLPGFIQLSKKSSTERMSPRKTSTSSVPSDLSPREKALISSTNPEGRNSLLQKK